MDNICIFMNYVIRDDIKFEKTKSGMSKAQFGASSSRPDKNGLWNKHFFVAFGDTADRLEKCKIQVPCFMTITCEQTVYKDKEGQVRENYVVSDFSLTPKFKSQSEKADEPAETPAPASAPVSEAASPKKESSTLYGLKDLESFFKD